MALRIIDMAVTWTIVGEAGKALDATSRTLEQLAVSNAKIDFRSLQADEFSFTIFPQTIVGSVIPDLGQTITLYRNGVRFFYGHVSTVRSMMDASSEQIEVVVSGPWWWMERINFTEEKTSDSGNTDLRLSYVFGTTTGVNLRDALVNAINRSITLQVPIALGYVAPFFNIPRVTLNQSNCAQIITELVRICPDAMVYFDYFFDVPRINITRRMVCQETAITIGESPVTSIQLEPVLELEVSKVELPYLDRDRRGRARFQRQSAGTASAGKVHLLTVSGPELDTFLPNDVFDSVTVRPTTFSGAIEQKLAADYISKYGSIPIRTDGYVFSTITYVVNGFNINTYTISPAYTREAGTPVMFGDDLKQTPPDWMIKQAGLIEAEVLGGIWGYSSAAATDVNRRIEFNNVLGGEAYQFLSGFYYTGKNFNSDGPRIWLMPTSLASQYTNRSSYIASGNSTNTTTKVSIDIGGMAPWFDDGFIGEEISFLARKGKDNTYANAKVIVTGYDPVTKIITHTPINATNDTWKAVTSDTANNLYYTISFPNPKYYRDSDYSFLAPPAGFSNNLLAAQNFLPYSGSVTLVQQDVGGSRYRGTKLNVYNSSSNLSSIGALVASESIDLATGTTVITVGSPPRLDYRTLTDKIRKTPQDNIIYV
jgi:hypothetical protein